MNKSDEGTQKGRSTQCSTQGQFYLISHNFKNTALSLEVSPEGKYFVLTRGFVGRDLSFGSKRKIKIGQT
jgi:hypothetical protein